MFLEQFERQFVVALGKRAIAHHVREHDGGELSVLSVFGDHDNIKSNHRENEMRNLKAELQTRSVRRNC